jgi:hypothetical protein
MPPSSSLFLHFQDEEGRRKNIAKREREREKGKKVSKNFNKIKIYDETSSSHAHILVTRWKMNFPGGTEW